MGLIKITPNQIETWVARHFEYKRRKGGDELLICNPFVPGDNKYKFNISTVAKKSRRSDHSNYWVHDWRPSAQQYNGSFLKFVQRYKGYTFKEAVKDVCGEGVDLRSILDRTKWKPREEETLIRMELPDNAAPITEDRWPRFRQMAINYLASRGIQYADAVSFRLHYTPTMIIFPYQEYDDIVYWQGRTFSHFDKTFLFPDQRKTGIGKSEFVYGFDNAESGHPIYVVEAIFCALTIGPGGIATGGARLVESQRRKIRALGPSIVVLAPDNDEEGLASIHANWKILSPYYDVYYVLPPEGCKDWNDFIKKADDKEEALKTLRAYIADNMKKLTLRDAVRFRMSGRD
jgi:DNA primase